MLKVECEGCRSPYQVDERRVPANGLKMRCPKCGTTFIVRNDSVPSAAPPPPSPKGPPASLRSAQSKRTVLGVGEFGGSPFAAPPIQPPPEPIQPPPIQPPSFQPPDATPAAPAEPDDLGLPVVAAGPARPVGAPPPVPAPRRAPPPPPPFKPPPPPAAVPPPPAFMNPPAPAPAAPPLDELDLPVVGAARPVGAPPPVRSATMPMPLAPAQGKSMSLDLPAAAPARPVPPPPPGLGLPAVPGASHDAPAAELDLSDAGSELDLPVPQTAALGANLPAPAPRADLPASAGAALPARAAKPQRAITGAVFGFGAPDLPAVGGPPRRAQTADFGDNFGELDLPLVADGNLPAPAGADLPASAGADAHLPAPFGADAHLPAPSDGLGNLPSAVDPFAHLPSAQPAEQMLPSSGGAFDALGNAPPLADAPVWPEAPGPTASSPGARSTPRANDDEPERTQVTRQAGGGIAFGEVNLLDDEGAPLPTDEPRAAEGDDMEFGAIPQETDGGAEGADGAVPDAVPGEGEAAGPEAPLAAPALPRKRSRALKMGLGAMLTVIVGGLAMSASPKLGVFGLSFISDRLNASDHAEALESSIAQARKLLGGDTAAQAKEAIALLDQAVAHAPRHAETAAYGAFLGFLRDVRFGHDPAVHAHAGAQLTQAAQTDRNASYLPIARAAEAASEAKIANARQAVQALGSRAAEDIDVAVLAAEIELLANEPKAALAAWDRASKLESSARTAYGRARALFAVGDHAKAAEDAHGALKLTPNHIGARVLLARIHQYAGREEQATKQLLEVVGDGKSAGLQSVASKAELVSAHTLLGQIHLSRSRMSASESAFAEALKLNPKDADALAGFGEVLYREGRYAEALARFEAGVQANPESVNARVGAAKTKIALERLQDAKEILRKLRESRPTDPTVAYWLAQAEEALGNKSEVEKILLDAIARNPNGPETINLYVALAQFLAAQGRMQDADAKLAEARKKLSDSPAIHKALGNVALTAGRLADAKTEFETALSRDPDDLSSLFNLGITLRRMGRFDEALEKFDKVSAVDRNYPGLALERGVLFEAWDQAQRALEMYQEALSKAPNDPDLMLRVGSAEVASGHASQAEEILRKVLGARPNSAEANHYLGRALLLKGNNLAEALRYLQRASEIDPNRAEYWLFVGWAANDAGQPSTAERALKKALSLDQSLADAYWQRGILLRRQGAVRDAERDLLRALDLKPSRFEAYGTLAEAYEDQSNWNQAIASWKKAIAADANRPFWRYKLGRLYYNSGNRAGALEELTRAVQLAAKESRPPWLWEAHLMLADVSRASGKRQEAIDSYREFLKLAPPDSPFRTDAIKALQGLGAPLED